MYASQSLTKGMLKVARLPHLSFNSKSSAPTYSTLKPVSKTLNPS